MTGRWARGEAVISGLIEDGSLQYLGRSSSNGNQQLARAKRTLRAARVVLDVDPDTAYANAYDSARMTLTALLIQQGLRPTQKGGHIAVERAVIAQFGPGFASFGTMRRRRNEIEYPDDRFASTQRGEAERATEEAERFFNAAEQLLHQLGFFGNPD